MLYYTFSQGYRPGAFNRVTAGRTPIWVDAAGNPLPNGVAGTCPPTATTFLQSCRPRQFNKPLSFAPDSLLNNEIGFKSEFLSHRLLVNASIYQMDWKDVQTLIYNPPVYGNTTFGVTGPTYRIKGGELQFAMRATEGLTLNASMSYNDSKQTTSPCIHSAGVTPTPPTTGGSPWRASTTSVRCPTSRAASHRVMAY